MIPLTFGVKQLVMVGGEKEDSLFHFYATRLLNKSLNRSFSTRTYDHE